MDKETFLKRIQGFVEGVPLIVLGSGATVPYGLPTMSQLAEQLETEINFNSDDRDNYEVWNEFKNKLQKTGDLETALQETRVTEAILKRVIKCTWNFVNEADKKAFDKIISNPQEFHLINLLKHFGTSQRELRVITTNYDRLAEYASSYTNGFAYTGFTNNYVGNHIAEAADQKYKQLDHYGYLIKIWKIHGSLDWFKNGEGVVRSFPHSQYIADNHSPCIITPGAEKYRESLQDPFRSILTQIDKDFSNASSFLCIGYGFNDEHVHPKLLSKAKNDNIPVVLATKEISKAAKREILNSDIQKYALIEDNGKNGTRVFLSDHEEEIVYDNEDFWSVSGLMSILK
ncbi:SIR2 family protein [Salibacter halophilus]|uniref:Uncharacterized protein n=1 Tax=Salibacter halophilus TaxID=1803916 RepID=A0A6N6M3R4_9FLAO|nr:SIR2 family protein [Salibacter halophilus]KAB1062106.1 hypothetical protein F3059_12515 [Salibacter halophilus]